MAERIIGIMGAMQEEIDGIADLMTDIEQTELGGRVYHTGVLNGVKVVLVFSRWGKVAAATTVAHLILRCHVTDIIFTGVAGAIHPDLRVGDIVLAQRLIHHDLDARPLLAQYEVPLLGKTYFDAHEDHLGLAKQTISDLISSGELLSDISADVLKSFDITTPKLYVGDIGSGDKFFSLKSHKDALSENLPGILCVEMEGAAVAQVCYEYGVPFCIIRTISDTADDTSHIDFVKFTRRVAGIYSVKIIGKLLENLT